MRVGLVVPGFSADADDWCIPALRHFARALATRDDVRVIAVRYPYRAARYLVDGVEVIAVGGAARRGVGTLDVWRLTLNVLRNEHRRHGFDVLHAFWATESGLLTAIAGRLLGIPTVVSLAGGELVALPEINYGDQRIAWERLKIAASLRLATAVTAGSEQLLALAAPHVPHRRLHRAPLGVDLELFNPGPVRPEHADALALTQTAPPQVKPTAAVTTTGPRSPAVVTAHPISAQAASAAEHGSPTPKPSSSVPLTTISATEAGSASAEAGPAAIVPRSPASMPGSSATAPGAPAAGAAYSVPERIHPAIEPTSSFAPAGPPRLVHVATLTAIKDQATLLRAFAILRQRVPDVTLDIVGDGPLRRELEQLAGELGVAPAVRFRGEVDHAALPDIYRGASVFVLSSRHEAQSMVAIEAAACGLPVVGTCVGVIAELAASPEAVVPVGAAAALADALAATLATQQSNQANQASRAQDVPSRARAEFGLEPCVARFRALYAHVTNA